MKKGRAKKNDVSDGKYQCRYIHPATKKAMGIALEAGDLKYGPFNFMDGHTVLQLLDALERHLDAFRWGEDFDHDCSKRLGRKVPHVGNMLACLNMLMAQQAEGTLIDDRYKGAESGKREKADNGVLSVPYRPDSTDGMLASS